MLFETASLAMYFYRLSITFNMYGEMRIDNEIN